MPRREPPAPALPAASTATSREDLARSVRYGVRVGAVVLVVVLYLIQISRVAALGYEIARAEGRLDDLQQETARLQVAVTRYQDLTEIERYARGRLGMVPAAPPQFLDLGMRRGTVQ